MKLSNIILGLCFMLLSSVAFGQDATRLYAKGIPEPRFVNIGDTLYFESLANQICVYRLKSDFLPASPPMQAKANGVNPQLKVDSFFVKAVNEQFTIQTEGLYFAQSDTNSNKGIGFLLVDKHFPKSKKINPLIESLIYISADDEISNIRNATEKKKALDDYWLKLGGTEEVARRMIRLYYARVEQANLRFTTYKEGWKTDMGMIFIIFGEPNRLETTPEGQQWIYHVGSRNQEIKFTFNKRPNQFSNLHFELVRGAKYEDIWYEKVGRWRMGLAVE